MNRALRVARPALTTVVALAAALVAAGTASGGGSALLVARAAVLAVLGLSTALVVGGVLVAAREPDDSARGRVLDVAAGAAGLWTVAAAVTGFLLYLGQAPAMDSPSFGPGLVTFVFEVAIGRTWLVAAVLAAVLTALLVAIRTRRGAAVLAVAVVVAAAPVALQSAMSGDALAVERGVVAAGFVQIVALGAWIGPLALRDERLLPPIAFAALVVGTVTALAVLAADGAVTPLAIAGAAPIAIAGVVAVVSAAARLRSGTVQLVLLGAGLGLGAAASVTQAVPDLPVRTTPAELLTGSPLPAAPSIGALAGSWQPDVLWLVPAVGLLVAYLVAAIRTSEAWPVARTVSWAAGLVLLVWLTSGGPAVYQAVLVAPWLAQHAALLLLVPLLLALGAPLRLAGLTAVRFPGPVPAFVVLAAVAVLLVGTDLFRWSVSGTVGTEVATAACLAAGLLLARALLEPGPRRRTAVVVAVVLLVAETAAAAGLATGSGLLAADWFGAMGWGTDALAAQRSAGPVVWPVVALPTVVLLVAALRSPAAAPLARAGAVVA